MTNLPSWSPEERDEWSRAVNLAKSGIFDPLTDLIEDQATKFIQTSKDHPAQKRFIDKVRGVPSRKIGKGLKNLAKSL